MFPFLARFALMVTAGRLIGRAVQHPRVAPIAQSRAGRVGLVLLGFGLRRHPRTRTAGHIMRQVARRSRGA